MGGDVEKPWLMSKYDVIHETGSTEEDRATTVGNMHKKFGEDRTCSSNDMIAFRQTHRQHSLLVTYRDGIPARRPSPINVLTDLDLQGEPKKLLTKLLAMWHTSCRSGEAGLHYQVANCYRAYILYLL